MTKAVTPLTGSVLVSWLLGYPYDRLDGNPLSRTNRCGRCLTSGGPCPDPDDASSISYRHRTSVDQTSERSPESTKHRRATVVSSTITLVRTAKLEQLENDHGRIGLAAIVGPPPPVSSARLGLTVPNNRS